MFLEDKKGHSKYTFVNAKQKQKNEKKKRMSSRVIYIIRRLKKIKQSIAPAFFLLFVKFVSEEFFSLINTARFT